MERGFKVVQGVLEPLAEVPGHKDAAGIERFLLLTPETVPGRSIHIAAHYGSGSYEPIADWRFTEPRAHPFDEINLVLPCEGGRLQYRYEVGGVTTLVDGPCTVFVPAGAIHRMEPVGGLGDLCVHPGPPRGQAYRLSRPEVVRTGLLRRILRGPAYGAAPGDPKPGTGPAEWMTALMTRLGNLELPLPRGERGGLQ